MHHSSSPTSSLISPAKSTKKLHFPTQTSLGTCVVAGKIEISVEHRFPSFISERIRRARGESVANKETGEPHDPGLIPWERFLFKSLDAHQKFRQLAQGSRMAQAPLEESLRLARRTAVLRTRMVEAMHDEIRTWVIRQGIDAKTRTIAEVTELGRCEAVMSECQFIAIERKIQLRIRRTDRRSHKPVISGKIVITGCIRAIDEKIGDLIPT
jgi:hypothetical protein